ncbi:MAG: class I SAM-dependent methyltransferase [Vicingaceae bacterium]|nr:class I SAM-dependent methyltransferase [Vicingaceae bacterium]
MKEQEFIKLHLNKKVSEIALLLSKRSDLDKDYIINQINGLQKAKNKLPEFYKNTDIIYPATISIEQCSSEQTATYKSKIINGKSLVDLTGGFGIDSFYFSKNFKEVTYLEPNTTLFNTVSDNFKTLQANNITPINKTAEDFLNSNTQKFDIGYIDPSRRNENQKVFMLADCIPNIVELQGEIFKIAPQIIVKTSPILDIKQSIKELKTVSEIWIVSVNNECKEVLFLLRKNSTSEIKINTVNLGNQNQDFSFTFNEEEVANVEHSDLLNYLYEPNVSILKAGAFKSICFKYGVKKIAPNTHLYTSEHIVKDFPGRTFKIEQVLSYQPKTFKKLGLKHANVSCRNFKDSVEQVKKKLNLKDGGDIYLFATTNNLGKPILILNSKA